MANLALLVAARNKQQLNMASLKRILIYGSPKSGKTRLAGTIAKVVQVKRIFWFDVENGSLTLLNPELGLTEPELKKVELIQLPDTKEHPIAIETLLKVFSNRKGITICEEHGRVDCVDCTPKPSKLSTGPAGVAAFKPVSKFPPIASLGAEDCIVIDSLSQVGDSALVVAERITSGSTNAYAKYGEQGQRLADLLGMIQQLRTNIICVTHVTVNEAEDTKKETVIPLCGTRNFSLKVAKYFNTVIHMSVEVKKFKAGSTPTYKLNTVAGDRLGCAIEKADDVDLRTIFNQ